MFAVEGYQSLKVFARKAYAAIYEPIRREDVRRWKEANDKGQPRPQHPFSRFNAELAARHLIYDLFSKLDSGAKRVQLLRADGVRLAFPTNLLKADSFVPTGSKYGSALKAESERRGKDHVSRLNGFDLEAMNHDYWVIPFLEEQAFFEPEITLSRVRRIDQYFSVVNWNTGCIDLTMHKIYLEGVQAFRTGINALHRLRIGSPPIKLLTNFAFDGAVENEELIRSLMPFDGCFIIAPEEWLEKIQVVGSVGNLDRQASLPLKGGPREMILSILDDEPGCNKKDVKAQVMAAFPKTSHRKFDQVWASVAEEKPHIQTPGRKSRHRFETEL